MTDGLAIVGFVAGYTGNGNSRSCCGQELTFTLPKRLKPRTWITARGSLPGGVCYRDLLAPEQREPANVDWGYRRARARRCSRTARTALIATWPAGIRGTP